MRTTLTIDDDVASLLEREVRRSGASFRATVNKVLRAGLAAGRSPSLKPFAVTPLPMGLPQLDSAEDLMEFLEGPLHK